jgi:hypothetical protein
MEITVYTGACGSNGIQRDGLARPTQGGPDAELERRLKKCHHCEVNLVVLCLIVFEICCAEI